ncbi:hypothetical protein ACFQPA_00815 [Halomarina halobia]|uniref:Uncharacterized protein n=1 Tax=Halomarina halobia TaxID=3033386 RepID=A0ABD6A6Y6_9EURY|nr:hypothetical protein [Halomarina sp. PSR21]
MTDALYWTVAAGVVAGLAVLLYAEAAHLGDAFVVGGGVVVLVSVGVLAAAIAWTAGESESQSGSERRREPPSTE